MKTTVEIADALLEEAKAVARRERTTIRALIDEGLRRALGDRRKRRSFKLRRASVGGSGLRPELKDAPWERVRDRSYGEPGA